MNLKHLFLAGAFALSAAVGAQAQVGIFGQLTGQRVTGVQCKFTTCSNTEGIDYLQGGGGGIYYNFRRFGPALLGVDVRADTLASNKSASTPIAGKNAARYTSLMGGARATFHVPVTFMRPYGEVDLGWVRRVNPQLYGIDNFFGYRVYGGLDFAVAPIMDVRVPEVGIGQNIGFGGVKSNTVESVSIGVVFHMPR